MYFSRHLLILVVLLAALKLTGMYGGPVCHAIPTCLARGSTNPSADNTEDESLSSRDLHKEREGHIWDDRSKHPCVSRWMFPLAQPHSASAVCEATHAVKVTHFPVSRQRSESTTPACHHHRLAPLRRQHTFPSVDESITDQQRPSAQHSPVESAVHDITHAETSFNAVAYRSLTPSQSHA